MKPKKNGWITRTATIPRAEKEVGFLRIIVDFAGGKGAVYLDDFSLKEKKRKNDRGAVVFLQPLSDPPRE